MRNLKRSLALLLAVVMTLSLLAVPVFADDILIELSREIYVEDGTEAPESYSAGAPISFAVKFSGNSTVKSESVQGYELFLTYDRTKLTPVPDNDLTDTYSIDGDLTAPEYVMNRHTDGDTVYAKIGWISTDGIIIKQGSKKVIQESGTLFIANFTAVGSISATEALAALKISPGYDTENYTFMVDGKDNELALDYGADVNLDTVTITDADGVESNAVTVSGTDITRTVRAWTDLEANVSSSVAYTVKYAEENTDAAKAAATVTDDITVSGTELTVKGKAAAGYYFLEATGTKENILGSASATLRVNRSEPVLGGIALESTDASFKSDTENNKYSIVKGAQAKTVDASLTDQYGDAFSDSVSWSVLEGTEHPITVEDGVVTVPADVTTGAYTIRATAKSDSSRYVDTSLVVGKSDSIISYVVVTPTDGEVEIPADNAEGEDAVATVALSAQVEDEEHIPMPGDVTWSIKTPVAGVSVDANGVVSVTNEAKAAVASSTTVTVTATSADKTEVSADVDVTVKRATASAASMKVTRDDAEIDEQDILPIDRAASKTYTYVVTVYDQYGEKMDAEAANVTGELALEDGNEVPAGSGVSYNDSTKTVTVASNADTSQMYMLTFDHTSDSVDNASFTIFVTDIEITWPTVTKAENAVYGQKLSEIVTLGNDGYAEIQGADGKVRVPGTFTLNEADGYPNAGDATVFTLNFQSTGDYEGEYNEDSDDYTIAIAKKEITVSWANTELTYNGQPQAPDAFATGAGNTALELVVEPETNAGEYTATATLSDADAVNYVITGEATQAYKIVAADVTGSAVITADPATIAEGTVLTANIKNSDADADDDLDYQWFSDGTPIEGATDKTYTVKASDTGAITVKATPKENGNFDGDLESSPVEVGKTILTGDIEADDDAGKGVGDTLSADTSGVTGATEDDFDYQWLRDGEPIQDATDKDYTITEDDLGKDIAVQITGKGEYTGELVSQAVTVDPIAPVITASATGTRGGANITWETKANGSTITKYTVTIKDAEGNTVQTVIVGAKDTSYTAEGLENRTDYTATVTATLADGTTVDSEAAAFTTTGSSGGGGGGGGIPAPASNLTVAPATNGTVTVDPTDPKAGDTVTVTVKADKGYVIDTLVLKDEEDKELNVLDGKVKANTYAFEMPEGKATLTATFKELKFVDVADESKYYYEPVYWAVGLGITTGTSNTEFSPNGDCTRAQFVTFLYRAAGEPAVTGIENPFTDVAEGKYYTDAVLWAVSKGITTGATDTTFEPDSTVNRAQAVTFLWRYAEKPEVEADVSFTDVPDGEYYTEAVKWAVSKGITNGTGNNQFSPKDNCIRAQVVTFLHRMIVGVPDAAEDEAKEDETPAEETPAEETPAEETPAEETPVEKPSETEENAESTV